MRHEIKGVNQKDKATRLWQKLIQMRSQLRMPWNVYDVDTFYVPLLQAK